MIKVICDGCQCEFDQTQFLAAIQITELTPQTLDGFRPGHAPGKQIQKNLHWCKDCMDHAMKEVDKLNQ